MPIYFAGDLKDDSKEITLDESESHHILNVLRKKVNEEVTITNGRGVISKAKINGTTKKKVALSITETIFFCRSTPKISLAFSLLKNKNDLLIVEKATELGVSGFFPFISERTVKKQSTNTKEKFFKTALSAIKQCENAYLPIINDIKCLKDMLKNQQNSDSNVLIASEIITQPSLFSAVSSSKFTQTKSNICLVVGPEGGFSQEEHLFFEEKNFLRFSLGNHILRAETASIAAVSMLSGYFFKLNPNYY